MSRSIILGHLVVHMRGLFAGLSTAEITLVLTFGALGLYSIVQLIVIDRKERRQERIDTLRASFDGRRNGDAGTAATTPPGQRWYQRLGSIVAMSPVVGANERSRLGEMLAAAGFVSSGWVPTLIAAKLGAAAFKMFSIWTLLEARGMLANYGVLRACVIMAAGLIGWRIPDMIIGRLGRRRRARIEQGLPDALDLLVICAEAGLSLEQGINFVAREIAIAFPDIARELDVTAAELRVLGDRRQALDNLARRIALPQVRSIVGTLVQTMKYGTPLAQSLRVLAAELRSTRLLKIEERAAQLPVLLSIPVVGFILPCTFLVMIGPAILQLIDTFSHMHIG